MKKRILEVCCGSYYDALMASEGQASRIELNSALSLGGLTPNSGVLELVKKQTNLKVICMVRPRASGFCYTKSEKEEMFEVAKDLLEKGADGLAFGFLNEDFTIDEENTLKMVNLIHSYDKEAVFHRAIDVAKDYFKSLEILIKLKVDRVLTSGQESKAIDGLALIKTAVMKYQDKIDFVIGSGVNPKNALEILEKTGASELHSSCKGYLKDITSTSGKVSYNYLADESYEVCDSKVVKEIVNLIVD